MGFSLGGCAAGIPVVHWYSAILLGFFQIPSSKHDLQCFYYERKELVAKVSRKELQNFHRKAEAAEL